jgi:hypothetical protein
MFGRGVLGSIMSVSGSPPPPISSARPRRRHGRWIALAIVVIIVLGAFRYGGPIFSTASFMVGRPYLPGCTTSVTKEGIVGALWYRISEQKCANVTRHYVFVARTQSSMSFLVTPAFMSIDSPVPVSLNAEGQRTYYISVSPPLEDGDDFVELFIGPSGVPLKTHIYENGRKR